MLTEEMLEDWEEALARSTHDSPVVFDSRVVSALVAEVRRLRAELGHKNSALAALVALDEREACAKAAESATYKPCDNVRAVIASAIRARSGGAKE